MQLWPTWLSFSAEQWSYGLAVYHYSGGWRRKIVYSWWRHQIETFSALLTVCAGNSPITVNSPHKGQWRGAFMFSLICARINSWENNRDAGDLRRHGTHFDVTVMSLRHSGRPGSARCVILLLLYSDDINFWFNFFACFHFYFRSPVVQHGLSLFCLTTAFHSMCNTFVWT